MSIPMHRQAVEAAVKATGQRWCSHHQGYASVEGGFLKQSGSVKRWLCARCAAPLTKGVTK